MGAGGEVWSVNEGRNVEDYTRLSLLTFELEQCVCALERDLGFLSSGSKPKVTGPGRTFTGAKKFTSDGTGRWVRDKVKMISDELS